MRSKQNDVTVGIGWQANPVLEAVLAAQRVLAPLCECQCEAVLVFEADQLEQAGAHCPWRQTMPAPQSVAQVTAGH